MTSQCEVEGRTPCPDLLTLRDRVQEIEDERRIMQEVSRRVGVMRADGTATPHSLTWAMQELGERMLELERTVKAAIPTPSSPPTLLDALGDLSEESRLDVQRPDLAILRRRKAVRQRNWVAIISASAGAVVIVLEALARLGVFK